MLSVERRNRELHALQACNACCERRRRIYIAPARFVLNNLIADSARTFLQQQAKQDLCKYRDSIILLAFKSNNFKNLEKLVERKCHRLEPKTIALSSALLSYARRTLAASYNTRRPARREKMHMPHKATGIFRHLLLHFFQRSGGRPEVPLWAGEW